MDYIFYSTLANEEFLRLVLSYDIACQWRSNFNERMGRKFPEEWIVNQNDVEIEFLVPKFHLPAHIEKCHREYSFNFTKYVGRTDGEGIERGWSRINELAGSTREMGPGARRDKLELHLGDNNWKKKKKLGLIMLDDVKTAVPAMVEQAKQLEELEQELDEEWVKEWREEVEAWEDDFFKANPYEPREKEMTQNDVRLVLATQDEARTSSEEGLATPSGITGSAMIVLGLELEEAQRRIREELAQTGLHPTALQQAKLKERCNVLKRRINSWYAVEALFIPGATLLRTLDAQRQQNASEPKPYDMKLYLPSEIKTATHVDPTLQETEWVLREAQAKDALISMRSHLRVDDHLRKDKRANATGVKQTTRSQTVIQQNLAKVKSAAVKYRRAHEALLVLGDLLNKGEAWKNVLRPLADGDIRGLPRSGLGEGDVTLSWIWLSVGLGVAGNGEKGVKVQDVLRLQWLRARARANHWAEEVTLLQEEMRRIKETLKYEAAEWEKRGHCRQDVGPALAEGLAAYAFRQARIHTGLHDRFEKNWTYVDQYVALASNPATAEGAKALENDARLAGKGGKDADAGRGGEDADAEGEDDDAEGEDI